MQPSAISTLASALDFGSARLEAISNNLSNVNTPGYKRKDVSFDALLDSITSDDSNGTSGDFSSDSSSSPTPTVTTDTSGSMRLDGNNVDIDAESGRLAAAQVYYQGAAQLLQDQFSNLKYVITGGS
jgi:flagellar basal-body rod protein FlgB